MNHKQFFEACKAGQPGRLYLFEGPEEFTKKSALDRIREICMQTSDVPEMNMSILNDPDADTLIAACETLPFMAPRRLVIVRECTMLTANGKTKEYDVETSAEMLKDYLPELPDTTCLVFYMRGKADGKRKLYNTIKKCGEIVLFDTL